MVEREEWIGFIFAASSCFIAAAQGSCFNIETLKCKKERDVILSSTQTIIQAESSFL